MATRRGYFSDFDLNGDDLSPDWEAMNILTPYAAAVYYYDNNDVQDTLAYIPITITRYTCGIPTPTIQTSTNCPTLTWTTRSPTGTTTGNIPCGITACRTSAAAPVPTGFRGQFGAGLCDEGTEFENCPCDQTSWMGVADAPVDPADFAAMVGAINAMESPAWSCGLTSKVWQTTTSSVCTCSEDPSALYSTIPDPNSNLACAFTTEFPELVSDTCTYLPSSQGHPASCPCFTGDTSSLLSYYSDSKTITECNTGQTVPTPTPTTPPGWTRNAFMYPAYSWQPAAAGCGSNNFPMPTWAAKMAGNDGAYAQYAPTACQTIQDASYWGQALEVAFNTHASNVCVLAYVTNSCGGADNEPYRFCATPACTEYGTKCQYQGPPVTTSCIGDFGFDPYQNNYYSIQAVSVTFTSSR
ncbi:hypothetical protein BDR22DRAFT_975168 [Usnea florida]